MQISCFAVDSVKAPMVDHLLVADLHCSQIQALVEGAQLPVLDGAPQGDPLQWISRGLRQRRAEGDPPRVLHLIAHGRPGAFRIGSQWIDANALKAHAREMAQWGVETIALWSCHVGAEADVVALLEELTGARVLASADWLGRDVDGNEQLQLGTWSLAESSTTPSMTSRLKPLMPRISCRCRWWAWVTAPMLISPRSMPICLASAPLITARAAGAMSTSPAMACRSSGAESSPPLAQRDLV